MNVELKQSSVSKPGPMSLFLPCDLFIGRRYRDVSTYLSLVLYTMCFQYFWKNRGFKINICFWNRILWSFATSTKQRCCNFLCLRGFFVDSTYRIKDIFFLDVEAKFGCLWV